MIKRILGDDQNAANVFKLNVGESGCCGDSVTNCQYTATYTQSNAISALVISEDGAARTLPCVPASTSAENVKAAILASIQAAGYEDTGNVPFAGVTVVDNGSTLTVTVTGNIIMTSITHAGGSASFDPDCNLENLCTFAITGYAGGTSGAAATDLYINGRAYNLGAITAGTTTAGDVSTTVQTQITAAGISGTAATTTTGSGGSQTYNITITLSETANTFKLNGVIFTKSACAQSYI